MSDFTIGEVISLAAQRQTEIIALRARLAEATEEIRQCHGLIFTEAPCGCVWCDGAAFNGSGHPNE